MGSANVKADVSRQLSVRVCPNTLQRGRRVRFESMQNDKWKSATVAAALLLSIILPFLGRWKITEEPSAAPHKNNDDDDDDGVGDVKALLPLLHQ